jgi:hypothetical protein
MRRIGLFVSPIESIAIEIHVHIDHSSKGDSFDDTLAVELPHF